MMDCIEKLKKIGLQEINAKTKIATKRLDDIFECRFDDIDRTRVKGFLSILQREYKIDMSEWLKQYDEYHKEKEELDKQNEEAQETKEAKNEGVSISFIDTTMENKTYKRLLVAFAVLLALFIIYFVYNNLSNNQTQTNNDEISTIDENIVDSNATIESSQISSNATMIDEKSDDALKEQNQSSDNNSSIDSNTDSMFEAQEAIITPKSPLWVGIIDLQTYNKKQVSISDVFSIKLDNSKIIRTGHGYFDINSPQLNKKYIGGNSKYFIYTREDGFREISKEEFLEFNRGQEW